jgi:hypothetical protein
MSNTVDAPHHPPSAAMELMSGDDACTERMLHDDDEVYAVHAGATPAPASSSHHEVLGVVDGERVVEGSRHMRRKASS